MDIAPKMVYLELFDESSEDAFIIKTALTEGQLKQELSSIIKEWEDNGFFDWTYEDVIETAEMKGILFIVRDYMYYKIYL